MDAFEALQKAGDAKGITMYRVSKALGKPNSYISNSKSRGSSPKCDTMASMAEVCGYSLALIPSDNVPDDALVIDPKENE